MHIRVKLNKRGLAVTEIAKWIIAFTLLVIVIIGIVLLRKKGINLIDYIVQYLRYRR